MSASAPEEDLVGELGAAPPGPLGTVLWVVTGASLVRGMSRLVGRLALAYRRPAVLRLTDRGLEMSHRTEVLGRVVRENETLIPLSNLSRITREVRYQRLGLYSGLVALAIGTYVGVGMVVDGVRVPGGSPSLIAMGVSALALGVVLDFVLDLVIDAKRNTCRVVVTPRAGRGVCIHGIDPVIADRVLSRVADSTRP